MKNHKHLILLILPFILIVFVMLSMPAKSGYADFEDFSGDKIMIVAGIAQVAQAGIMIIRVVQATPTIYNNKYGTIEK